MDASRLEHSAALLVALRVAACRHDRIVERKVFGCPSFFVGQRMMACVYGEQIALKLPQLAVTALLETHGCTVFQPFGRRPMPRWLAFGADSPAFASLEDLFEESLSFVSELPTKE
ncbi:hypothetical protein BN2476_1190018 [Paraburkholderia piptadeniae]|uniref:TfoX N-terminal domain-containing protein n=1 Tax=Paraburkholderia piptadeniae TaxID=1701573 RepID=A0A1N7SVF5_9BURK|nr:TfoX/Sxy family protein [Paraburkholderia piptadeniae]SIT51390.1 hypothetical protein BN2476_1190018 [Paraburkholderia piptadeniae]